SYSVRFDSPQRVEQFHRHMRRAAGPRRAVIELIRPCFDERYQLLDRARWEGWMNREKLGNARDLGDGRGDALGLEPQLAVKACRHGVGRHGADEQRIAVGRRLHHALRASDAAAARAGIDDYAL